MIASPGIHYRSDEQVEAEAEMLALIHGLRGGRYTYGDTPLNRAYFISNSLVLDRISGEGYVITWTPEAVYRYLISLPGVQPQTELLHECMLHSYYESGITAINKEKYRKFFGSYIKASGLSLTREKNRYHAATEQAYRTNTCEEVFRVTPDLQKPLFVNKIGWRILEIAERSAKEANVRAEVAEKELRMFREETKRGKRKSSKAREKQLDAEARNRLDPKHVRKRRQQKKNRDRGK